MAWEWVAPTVTAVVGVAGITATWLTALGARKAQAKSEERTLAEARHRDLTARRQVVYAEFVGAAREMSIYANVQGAVDEFFADPAHAEVDPTFEASLRKQISPKLPTVFDEIEIARAIRTVWAARREKAKADTDVYDRHGWMERLGALYGLLDQVRLLAGDEVSDAARAVTAMLGNALIESPSRSPEQQKALDELSGAIDRLATAMVAELHP